MIDLLTLLTLSASSASSAVPSSVRSARIAEIRNRLHLVDAPPTRPLTDYERFFTPMRSWPQWAKWAELLASRFGAVSNGLHDSRLFLPGIAEVERLFPYRDTLVRWMKALLDPSCPLESFYPPDRDLQAMSTLFTGALDSLSRSRSSTVEPLSRSFANNFWKAFSAEEDRLQVHPGFPRIDAPVGQATLAIGPSRKSDYNAFTAFVVSPGQTVDGLSKTLTRLEDRFITVAGQRFPVGLKDCEWGRWYWTFDPPRKPFVSTQVFLRYEEPVDDGPPMVVLMESSYWDGRMFDSTRFFIVRPGAETLVKDGARSLVIDSGLLGYFDGARRHPADPRAALFSFLSRARTSHLPPAEIQSVATLFPFMQRAEEAFARLGLQLAMVKMWCTVAIPSIIDWAEAEHIDLSRFSPAEAWAQALTWHRGLSAGLGFGLPPPTSGPVLVRWADGATLQKLDTRVAIRDEGTSMGHCVGGPIDRETRRASGSSSYIQAVRDGTAAIWSYRDAAGLPKATLEVAPMHRSRMQAPYVVNQVQGPEDGPVEKLVQRRLWSFLVTMARDLPSDYALSEQARHKLSIHGDLPVNWNELPIDFSARYDEWLEQFKIVEQETVGPRFHIPGGLGSLTWDGIQILSDCLHQLDVSVNTSDAGGGNEMFDELIVHAPRESMRLLFSPRGWTTRGHGWRLLRDAMMAADLSGFHANPLDALIQAGVVTKGPLADPRKDVIFVAPRDAWVIQPWLTPAGNLATKSGRSP